MFRVPNVHASTREQHDDNLADYAERVAELLLSAKRARKYGPSYRQSADDLATQHSVAFLDRWGGWCSEVLGHGDE